MQPFLYELLFKLRHTCIIRIYGFNYGDEKHKSFIPLLLEPKSLEKALNNDKLNSDDKNTFIIIEFKKL